MHSSQFHLILSPLWPFALNDGLPIEICVWKCCVPKQSNASRSLLLFRTQSHYEKGIERCKAKNSTITYIFASIKWCDLFKASSLRNLKLHHFKSSGNQLRKKNPCISNTFYLIFVSPLTNNRLEFSSFEFFGWRNFFELFV